MAIFLRVFSSQPPWRGLSTCKPDLLQCLYFLCRVYMANKVGSVLKPDLYNEQERQVCAYVKSSGVVDDVFDKVRPIPTWNLYANDNEGWDELEKRHRYFWSR